MCYAGQVRQIISYSPRVDDYLFFKLKIRRILMPAHLTMHIFFMYIVYIFLFFVDIVIDSNVVFCNITKASVVGA